MITLSLLLFSRNQTANHRGAGATGAAGATTPIAQTVRGQHGGNRLPFYRNYTSKFVRDSQELEFITIFKQYLLNF